MSSSYICTLIYLAAYSPSLLGCVIDIRNVTCVKLLKFQIFCPKSYPSVSPTPWTSASLPFFLLSKLKPLEQYLSPSFLTHSILNLLGNDGGCIYRTYSLLLTFLSEPPSSLAWILSYSYKICQIMSYFHFTQIRKTSLKMANMISCSATLLSSLTPPTNIHTCSISFNTLAS